MCTPSTAPRIAAKQAAKKIKTAAQKIQVATLINGLGNVSMPSEDTP